MYTHYPHKRYRETLSFLKTHVPTSDTILDLGVENPFTNVMTKEGYQVTNTSGQDLDEDYAVVNTEAFAVVTAFEIFEHLLSPYNVLKAIKANQLVVSVPLKLWFSSAYRSKTETWDRHYHEFEDWQFDWLLEKTGWQIQDSVKFTNPVKKIGIRPVLRYFIPRYYLVYATR